MRVFSKDRDGDLHCLAVWFVGLEIVIAVTGWLFGQVQSADLFAIRTPDRREKNLVVKHYASTRCLCARHG